MAILTVDEAEEMKAFVPIDCMFKIWDAKDSGRSYIEISDSKLMSIRKKWEKYNYRFNVLLPECVERNNQGIRYEKQGNIEEAIKIYEENIKPGCYPARHSFDRLLVLYRKRKDYQNEQRVCKLAISVFKEEQKYKERLVKIENLISKSK